MKHFEAYLARASESATSRAARREAYNSTSIILGLVASVALYFTLFRSIGLSVVLFFGWMWLSSSILEHIFKADDAKRRERQPMLEEGETRIVELNRYRTQKTLVERLHPRVADAADRCAGLANAIRQGVDEPRWRERHSGADWQRVVEQAKEAADTTMLHVVMSCVGGYRPKGMPRKAWIEQVNADPEAKAATAALAVYEQELQQLADGLGIGKETGSPIGIVLQNLAEIRAAEEELDELTLGQG